MSTPGVARSRASTPLATAPVDGALRLQACADCGAVQYPPRERCGECLGDALGWRVVEGAATVLAVTRVAHSLEPWFAERAPWAVASLRLDAGPVVFAHLGAADAAAGTRLRVATARAPGGGWCLVAFAAGSDDAGRALRECLAHLGMDA